jgi:hypothetical protein
LVFVYAAGIGLAIGIAPLSALAWKAAEQLHAPRLYQAAVLGPSPAIDRERRP